MLLSRSMLCVTLQNNLKPHSSFIYFASLAQNKLFNSSRCFIDIVNRKYADSSLEKAFKEGSKEIYNAPLKTQIKAIKLFSLTTSAVGLCGQPLLLDAALNSSTHALMFFFAGVVTFFTFITPIFLHLVVRRYVTAMEYNEKYDTYTAHTFSFFCFDKKTIFKASDVIVPSIEGFLTTFTVEKHPMFVDLKFFEVPHHYKRLLHYDVPVNYHMSTPPENTSK